MTDKTTQKSNIIYHYCKEHNKNDFYVKVQIKPYECIMFEG